MNKERELLKMWIGLIIENRAVIKAEPYTAKNTRITDRGEKNSKYIANLMRKTTAIIETPQHISPYNPAHNMYDTINNCCGIFNSINDEGILCCNECGMTITELCDKLNN